MLMTVADVCEQLQCSAAKVYRLVRSGQLQAYKSTGRTGALRFSGDHLDEYLAASVVRPREPCEACDAA